MINSRLWLYDHYCLAIPFRFYFLFLFLYFTCNSICIHMCVCVCVSVGLLQVFSIVCLNLVISCVCNYCSKDLFFEDLLCEFSYGIFRRSNFQRPFQMEVNGFQFGKIYFYVSSFIVFLFLFLTISRCLNQILYLKCNLKIVLYNFVYQDCF